MEQDIPMTKQASITQEKIKKQRKKWRKSYTKNQIAIDI